MVPSSSEIILPPGRFSFTLPATHDWLAGAKVKMPPTTPSAWFTERFPLEAETFGPPLLEYKYEVQAIQRIYPAAPNETFFAAILGGERRLGHKVVYYAPEGQWYFFDPKLEYFTTTTEEKLKILLGYYLVQCAQEMSPFIDIGPLILDFRRDAVLDGIIKKARAILAADASFFAPSSIHKREPTLVTPEQSAQIFVEQGLDVKPFHVLTLSDCFGAYGEFCHARSYPRLENRRVRSVIQPIIRQRFGLAYRKDLKNSHGRYERGWKGIESRCL